jgi:hypothetical protein
MARLDASCIAGRRNVVSRVQVWPENLSSVGKRLSSSDLMTRADLQGR